MPHNGSTRYWQRQATFVRLKTRGEIVARITRGNTVGFRLRPFNLGCHLSGLLCLLGFLLRSAGLSLGFPAGSILRGFCFCLTTFGLFLTTTGLLGSLASLLCLTGSLSLLGITLGLAGGSLSAFTLGFGFLASLGSLLRIHGISLCLPAGSLGFTLGFRLCGSLRGSGFRSGLCLSLRLAGGLCLTGSFGACGGFRLATSLLGSLAARGFYLSLNDAVDLRIDGSLTTVVFFNLILHGSQVLVEVSHLFLTVLLGVLKVELFLLQERF